MIIRHKKRENFIASIVIGREREREEDRDAVEFKLLAVRAVRTA